METAGKLFSPELLSEIRDRFIGVDGDELSGPRLAFDSAAGALKLKTLPPLVAQENSIPGQLIHDFDPVTVRVKEIIKKGEEDLRIFLNAKDGIIYPAFAAGEVLWRITMAAVEYIPGSNIVTTNLEHPSSYDSMRRAAEKFAKAFRVAPINKKSGRVDPESILRLIDKNTSVLSVIHASNTTGSYTDIAAVCREARKIKEDLVIIIDGVQYAPHAPVDVDLWKPDAYVFGPYKITGMRGWGIGYLSERLVGKLPRNYNNYDGMPETHWRLGSRNHANYAAWSNTMDHFSWLGAHFTESKDRRELTVAAMSAIKEHMLALADLTVNGVNGVPGLNKIPGVTVYGMSEIKERTGVIIFSIDKYSAADLLGRYCQKGIHLRIRYLDPWSITPLMGMGINKPVPRMSMCHYASPAEVEKFLKVTAEFAAQDIKYEVGVALSDVDMNPAG
ncbi:MAG: aminotransferase class V-fold PLP-dependent enzyme [SAR324 cluster bacterium]|nr:aminotransferase class V-fold PLP-dependent enzyme [SAR324 cluster bacterium]